jgi:hypothetical protein
MNAEVLHDDGPELDLAAIDELVGLHARKRLELAFTVGLSGYAHIHGDPHQLVTELLRLARTGALAEDATKHDGAKPVRLVVHDARRRWRLDPGSR